MTRDEVVAAFLEAHRTRPPKGYIPTDHEVAIGKYTPRLEDTPPDKIQYGPSVPASSLNKRWRERSKNEFYEHVKKKLFEEKQTKKEKK